MVDAWTQTSNKGSDAEGEKKDKVNSTQKALIDRQSAMEFINSYIKETNEAKKSTQRTLTQNLTNIFDRDVSPHSISSGS